MWAFILAGAVDEIIAAPGRNTDLREQLDQAPGGNILGHQHASSKRHALASKRRFDGEAAMT